MLLGSSADQNHASYHLQSAEMGFSLVTDDSNVVSFIYFVTAICKVLSKLLVTVYCCYGKTFKINYYSRKWS